MKNLVPCRQLLLFIQLSLQFIVIEFLLKVGPLNEILNVFSKTALWYYHWNKTCNWQNYYILLYFLEAKAQNLHKKLSESRCVRCKKKNSCYRIISESIWWWKWLNRNTWYNFQKWESDRIYFFLMKNYYTSSGASKSLRADLSCLACILSPLPSPSPLLSSGVRCLRWSQEHDWWLVLVVSWALCVISHPPGG